MAIVRSLCFALLLSCFNVSLWALEVTDDGRQLIQQAARTFQEDVRGRATVQDKNTQNYLAGILKRLLTKGPVPPNGVSPQTVIVDSTAPELYAYVDGHIIITNGTIYALDNEAQLAALLGHELANVIEGYNIEMYQQIKAKERAAARRSMMGGILGELAVIAADYAYEVDSAEQVDRLSEGEANYKQVAKRMAKAGAARDVVYTAADVLRNIPAKNDKGQRVDPRLQFEMAADVQAMQYLAKAGYDTEEAASAWRHFLEAKNRLLRQQEKDMGMLAEQLRLTQQMMRQSLQQAREAMGETSLIRTLGDASPGRDDFVASLTGMKEVRDAQAGHKGTKGDKEFRTFIQQSLLTQAQTALDEERYQEAANQFEVLYNKGVKEAPVLYGLAKSRIGDFAFAATAAQKREAERLYQEAATLDKRYALPYRGLGELYEDWERFEDALDAYQTYLKLAPKALDRRNVERKLKTLQRKAAR
jgi:predicted Zn-dependent protease